MALLPLGYPRAVISLGIIRGDNSFVHKGTGFLCRHPLCNTADGTRYLTFLITNRHVVEKGVTHVRFDRITEDAVGILEIAELVPGSAFEWAVHATADVAARPVAGRGQGPLMEGRTEDALFFDDIGAPNAEEMRHIVEGNGVFVLGFPMGLAGRAHNYPIVRRGVIARIQDYLRGHASTFLIDAPAFPGSSGGPVVAEPHGTAVQGTSATTHALLIGVVSHYIPYKGRRGQYPDRTPSRQFRGEFWLGRGRPH